MSEYTTFDIINAAVDGNALEVKDAFDSILADRIEELLVQKKVEIAQSYFETSEGE